MANSQGHGSTALDMEFMSAVSEHLKDTLSRLRLEGIGPASSNSHILSWYLCKGQKLQSKSKFRDLLPTLVYLLRQNDLNTIASLSHELENIRSLEKSRSDELKLLRAKVESFSYDKKCWARQSQEFEDKITQLKRKRSCEKQYTSALENYCSDAGFPVADLKDAAIQSVTAETSDSDEDNATFRSSQTKKFKRTQTDVAETKQAPDKGSCSKQHRAVKTNQVLPQTQSRTSSKHSTARIAVLKTITKADNQITKVSRSLTIDECSKHKEIVGMLPRKGPFQPYWDTLMLQASIFNLEPGDVWQIVISTIPDELRYKMPLELKNGTIMNWDETTESVQDMYQRLKQTLLALRGPTYADWSKILEMNQENAEPFEVYAQRLWVVFKEHSGMEDANQDTEVLLQIIKKNAGPHIQRALAYGNDPAENTFASLVQWGSKIESRLKTMRNVATISASVDKRGPEPKLRCNYCRRTNHTRKDCTRLKRKRSASVSPTSHATELLSKFNTFMNTKGDSIGVPKGPQGTKPTPLVEFGHRITNLISLLVDLQKLSTPAETARVNY